MQHADTPRHTTQENDNMATHVIIDGVRYTPAPIHEQKTDRHDLERMLTALDVRFDSDAGDNLSVREYFGRLAEEVWREEEGFSGKRPFGNSGWQPDVIAALVGAGFIGGKIDGDGQLDYGSYDRSAAESYIIELIRLAFTTPLAPARAEKTGMPPHQSRVLQEKVELDEKIGKLRSFIDGPIFERLPDAERKRLLAQGAVMDDYSMILGERIAAFTTNA